MKPLLPRLLQESLQRSLASAPVVVVTGARQTGKSTLVGMDAAGDRQYLSLDDLDVLAQARDAPDELVRRAPRLTLDEVQRSPDLLLAVKRAVDQRPDPGRFLLTGSANLLLMRKVSETLAGRAIYLNLWPLTRRERLGHGSCGAWTDFIDAPLDAWPEIASDQAAPREDWREAAALGGYPRPAYQLEEAEPRSFWFTGYTRTYLERDLQELSLISNLVDFRRLMRAASLRLGNLVNQSGLGRDVGLSTTTARRYLGLLEASYQIVPLPAYAVNRTKRLIKAPKLYWSDTALALHLAGESSPRGPHLENLVLCDLQAWRDAQPIRPEVLYWRTSAGDEVDFVTESLGKLLAIEVKATRNPGYGDTKGLRVFLAEYPELAVGGLLLHDGRDVSWLGQRILAVPWWQVL